MSAALRHLIPLAAGLVVAASLAAAEFPYTAVTNRDDVPVRCGPGEHYYATESVAKGTVVEVYRHSAGDWCAIRPLDNSISLVPSTQTRLAEGDSLAEIIAADAVSWIGSHVDSPPELVWQVQLDKGEAVEIVGLMRREKLEGPGNEVWYKIRPPAGEFRYVNRRDLDLTAAAEPAAIAPRASALRAALHVEPVPADAENNPADADVAQSQWRVRTSPRVRKPHDAADEPIALEPRKNPVLTASAAGAASPRPAGPAVSPSEIDAMINALEVDLTLMAAEPLASWSFTEIQQKLAQLRQADTTPAQRASMARFRSRLNPFVELREKQLALQALADPATAEEDAADLPAETPVVDALASSEPVGTGLAESPASVAAADDPLPGVAPPNQSLPAEYDGVGYLMPVISREQQAPPFAILDENGKVLSFVSPVPGLNLRRYLKQEVGVIGQRGYLPKYQATHLTAQRIIVLERHR